MAKTDQQQFEEEKAKKSLAEETYYMKKEDLANYTEKELLMKILKFNHRKERYLKSIANNAKFFFWAYIISFILGFIAFMEIITA